MKELNLFSKIPEFVREEVFETILETEYLKLERILSSGQSTPPGKWYDQEGNEWVVLLQGSAGLLFEGEKEARVMHPGDAILIPAGRRHRVEWTDSNELTIWLALHY